MVCGEFRGDATLLWKGKTAVETMCKFPEVDSVGSGTAAMLVNLLVELGIARFSDPHNIPVKPDGHVSRVMMRLGLVPLWGTA